VRWDLPGSIRAPNLKFLASPVPKIQHGWVREGCAKTRAWISVVLYYTPPNLPVNIIEWSLLYANVLDFRCIFALSNYGANCLRLGMKNGANFGFFGPVHFRGHFKEIGIAKVLLKTKPRGKVSGMSVFERLRKCGERKN